MAQTPPTKSMANYVLEILDGDRAGDVLPVSDQPLRIGRKPSNDLVLSDEKTSGVHAEVVLEGDRHVLRDLGSTNGTFLDEKRVTEIVLSVGDVVTIGRLRVKFRAEGDAAGVGGSTDLAVHQLDASRLKKRSGSMALLGLLVVAGLGAGGYVWWQNQPVEDGVEAAGRGRKDPLVLAGNKLKIEIAACEGEAGWNLHFAGSGFSTTSRAHTGSGAFEAVRGEGADAPDFAIATLQEPLTVLGGRTLTVRAFFRTEGEAFATLRAVFFSSNDSNPFRFRTGIPLHEHPDWHTEDAILAVPPGCDRLQLELVAVLRSAAAKVAIDDVSVVEEGQGAALESKLNESSQTAIGTGAAMAVRSVDPDNPATLLAVLPDRAPAWFAGLQKAGLLVLSDLGATWQCTANERSFQMAANGADSLQFVFPADSAGSLLVSGADGRFASAAAESQFTTKTVLLGDRMTRAALQFDAEVVCTGQVGGGVYRLSVATGKAELVLGFRAEKNEASALQAEATSLWADGRPGAAIDKVRELVARVPQDSEVLSLAQTLRANILASQADTLRALQKDLAEATFFDTRGGFQRTVLGVDDLVLLYGKNNIDDLAGVEALRTAAQTRLDEIDGAQHGSERAQLEKLGEALTKAQQPGLAAVVQAYVKQHLGGK